MDQRYLVVLNQPVGEVSLEQVAAHVPEGSCRIRVLVPAIPPRHGFTYTEGEAYAVARRQLDRALGWFHERGLQVDGAVGDPSPVETTRDAVREERFAKIILATPPAGLSRWFRMDLPSRLERSGISFTCLITGGLGPPATSLLRSRPELAARRSRPEWQSSCSRP